jgi:hypothetical protein
MPPATWPPGWAKGALSPDRAITRAEFTALLQRALALPAAGAGKEFSDVRPRPGIARR